MASLVNPTKHLKNNKYQFLEDEGILPNLFHKTNMTLLQKYEKRFTRKNYRPPTL